MNKNLKRTILTSLLMVTTSAMASVNMTKAEVDSDLNLFPKMLKNKALSVTKSVKESGFDHLELVAKTPRGTQKFEVFIIKGENPTLLIGKAFDTKGNPYKLPLDKKLIKESVLFSLGTGDKQLYLVTDPECPYCQKMESKISKDSLGKYTINFIPMPLSFHKDSKNMLYWVLSGKTNVEKADRMNKVMSGDTTYKTFKVSKEDKAKFDKMLQKSTLASVELGARGTPSLFDSNMKPISSDILMEKVQVKAPAKIDTK